MDNQIALLPLDNRPVSYLLPKQIASFSGIELILPERKQLGSLRVGANLEYIDQWLQTFDSSDQLIIALDAFVYGGLVQSRRHDCGLDVLKQRASKLSTISKSPKYAFSTILRISDSNINEEEQEYWNKHGKDLFKWSELMHKVGRGICDGEASHSELIENWYQATQKIPTTLLAHYKNHRDKNFTINNYWLDSLHHEMFKYLIFACDDSSKYGMNVVEAEYLKKLTGKHKFSYLTKILSGTDEIVLLLMTKALIHSFNKAPSVSLLFGDEKGKELVGRYETSSIFSTIQDQLQVLNLVVKDASESDLIICIHVSSKTQGDHIFGIDSEGRRESIDKLLKLLLQNSKPFVIVDLAYANGSDPILMKTLVDSNINWDLCYGYAGWNTSANSSGSAIAMGICRWIAEKNKTFNMNLFKEALITRILDDYVYQAVVRKDQRSLNSNIADEMKKVAQSLSKLYDIESYGVKYTYPWERTFEIEVSLEKAVK